MLLIAPLTSRDEKIRTSDLQHPMLARYLATLHPEKFRKSGYNATEAGYKYINCTANVKCNFYFGL
jgi:hypothetical protein